jgi:uncharacterized protein YfaP (DUF2135 family)
MTIKSYKRFGTWLVVIALSSWLGLAAAAEITSEQANQMRNEAIASALTMVFEEASGIPASGIATMAGQLSAGDFSGGIMTAANIVTDTALGLIPGVGPVKFVIGLETAVINVGKSYLDNYLVDVSWGRFKNLSTTDQDAWINGQYVAEMEAAMGGYYTERNVTDIRSLFKAYRDQMQAREATMRVAANVIADLNKAKYFYAAEAFVPSNGGTLTYSPTAVLEWWANDANYFQITLTAGGSSYTQTVKIDPYDISPTIALSAFGVDWNSLFEENSYQPLDVSWTIKSARYDSTGLLESVYGSEVVTPGKLVHISGYDSVKDSQTYSFRLKSDVVPLLVSITSPSDHYETSDNQVTVTATVTTENGGSLPGIGQVGFGVNGEVQYATLSGGSFSTVAILASGDNSIIAGAITADGHTYLSRGITVKSNALNNTYHVRITWDKDDTDVDLHFSWNGSDCYYANKSPTWGDASTSPTLDVDDVNGYGPENITIDALPGDGSYKMWVRYYSDHDNGGTTVNATITKDGRSIYSNSRYMSDGENWTLLEFSIP